MAACALLPLAVVLGGCALLDKVAPASAAEPAPVLQLDVVAPDALATLLRTNLDLGRVNKLARGEPLQEGELDRLLAAAPQQARELLDTEGYFNAVVTVQRMDAAAPAAGTEPLPRVRVAVQAGPRTLVRNVDIAVQGPLADARGSDAHARSADQALRRDWPLQAGQPFRDADWSRAKTASIAGLRAQGYVEADWLRTQATVDAATQRADLAASVASGPLYRIGALRVRGLKVQDEGTVVNIANLNPGAPATEATLLDIQERLQKSDLFSSATVSLDTTPPQPDATPVVVRLGERQLQEATFGVGVGANVGPRLTVNHVHRRPFGQPWVARNNLDLSRVLQRWNGELSTQTLPGLYRNLVGASLSRETSDTDVVNNASLRVGRAQETRRISRLLFVDWNRSTTTSALGRSQSDALALQYHGVWRAVDDLVLPTDGRAWTGQFGAGMARSNPGSQGPFGRVYGRLDAFRPLGAGWFGQGRVELGQIFSRNSVLVPETLRFRAGGDESVRGYAYRSLTRQVNGVDVGSEVLFTASAEAAHPILASIPQLWGAVFVDVGRAAATWSDLKPAVGVGVGLRYRSPVGPVKLDLAYGQEVRKLRLHLTVGLAF
jgi:translocation and assembly module TamA